MVGVQAFSVSQSTYLNLLRAFAAQVVVVGHTLAIGGLWPAAGEPNSPYMQSLGVIIFFVLSGYVITNTTRLKTQSNNGYSLPRFVLDRFSRIYTVYLPALVVVLMLTVTFRSISGSSILENLGPLQFLGNLFMLQSHPLMTWNWLTALFGGPIGHVEAFGLGRPFWSIAVEWWFYLGFGGLYFSFVQWKQSSVKFRAFLLVVTLAGLVVPLVQISKGKSSLSLAWILGAGISFLLPWASKVLSGLNPKIIALVGFSILVGSPVPLYLQHRGAYSLSFVLNFSLGLILTLVSLNRQQSPRLSKLGTVTADYSYSLYAIHYPIVMLFLYVQLPPVLWFISVVISCNIVSYVFYMLFEQHHRRVRSFLLERTT